MVRLWLIAIQACNAATDSKDRCRADLKRGNRRFIVAALDMSTATLQLVFVIPRLTTTKAHLLMPRQHIARQKTNHFCRAQIRRDISKCILPRSKQFGNRIR